MDAVTSSAPQDSSNAPMDQANTPHRDIANAIRALAMDAVQKANSGHPGMPMGMADVATVLFTRFLKFDPAAPDWADRDRFVLSAGHGSMLLYALLHLTGYEDMTMDELRNFRQLGSRTAGHPEYGHAAGIETTTGPLGQGLANAVGMALAERLLNARFGDDLVDHYTYVIAGDGCLMEGVSHEAISMAGHLKLNKLIVLFDDNAISIDGSTDLAVSDDQLKRFESSGWATSSVDGHDPEAIAAALSAAQASDRPSLIACKTTIGYGAPNKQGTAATHGSPLGEDEVAGARKELGWPHAAFELPEPVLSAWRAAGARGAEAVAAWRQRLEAAPADRRQTFERQMAGKLPEGWKEAVAAFKAEVVAEAPSVASRVSSQKTLDVLTAAIPELVGGSADLTGSNNTKTKAQGVVSADDFSGSYLHYGVREHGMAAAMNGIALHGGLIPYGGTFLVFTDYCRPSMRLSALMKQRVIYVMTHDSIGLGEDGPTHQPVEHLAISRATPNTYVLRPADTVETAEAWEIALTSRETPTVLSLTRQGLPTLRLDHKGRNLSAQGAYVLAKATGKTQAVLIATGSEVSVAMQARAMLEREGIGTRVVSMPCMELFAEQDEAYRRKVLPAGPVRVGIEAAVRQGWDRWLSGERGRDAKSDFIGMTGFGASAPAAELFEQFGITAEAACAKVKALLA